MSQNFRITIDEQQALDAINNVEQGLQDLNRGADGLGGNVDNIGSSFDDAAKKGTTFTSVMKMGVLAIGTAFVGLAKKMYDFVDAGREMAMQSEGIEIAFKRLDNPDLLRGLREATKNTVSDINLMQAAVKAQNFGIPVEKLGGLLKFAQQQAQATGESVDYLVDSIVTGLGRESVMILDNLQIDVGELQNRVKQSGDFMGSAIDMVNQKLTEMGDTALTESDKQAQAANRLEAAQIKIGKSFMWINDIKNKSVISFADWIDKIAGETRGDTEIFDDQIKKVAQLESTLPRLTQRYEELKSQTYLTESEQKELQNTMEEIARVVPIARGEFDEYGKLLSINTGKVEEYIQAEKNRLAFVHREAIKALQEQRKDLEKERDRYDKISKDGAQIFTSGGMFGGGTAYIDKTDATINNAKDKIHELGNTIQGIDAELARLDGSSLQEQMDSQRQRVEQRAIFMDMNRKQLEDWIKDERNANSEYLALAKQIKYQRFSKIVVDDKAIEKQRQQLNKLNSQQLQNERKLEDERSKLDVLGIEDKISQIDLEHKARLKGIQREKEDFVKANKGASTEIYDEREKVADAYYQKQIKIALDATQKEIKDSLSEYKTYYEQRQEIQKKAAENVQKAKDLKLDSGVIDNINKEAANELSKLDFKNLMENTDLTYLFDDISNRANESISLIISELERLRDANANAWSVEELKIFNDQIKRGKEELAKRQPIQGIQEGISEYKKAANEIQNLKKQIASLDKDEADSTEKLIKLTKALAKEEDNRIKAQDKINKGANEMGKGISDSAGAMGEVVGMLGNLGIEMDESVSGVLGGIGQMGDALASLDMTNPASIVSSAMGMVAGLGNAVGSMLGSEKRISEETYRVFNNLMETLNDVISAQKELISLTAGKQAQEETEKAIRLVEMQIEANRKLGKEYLNTGQSWKSRSHGYKLMKQLRDYKKELESVGISYDELGGRADGFFDMNAKQLERLKKDAPLVWAKLDDEVRQYLQSIIDAESTIEELQNTLKEIATGTTFEGFLDSALNEIQNFKGDIQDLADFSEETITKAMLNMFKQNTLRAALEPFYNDLANMFAQDLSSSDKGTLEGWSNKFTEELLKANKELEAFFEMLGFDLGKEADKVGKGSQGMSISMSQETGDEISGMVRNMQMVSLNMEAEQKAHTMLLNSFNLGINNIQQEMQIISNTTIQSMYYLKDIKANTNALNEMNTKLTTIVKNTE